MESQSTGDGADFRNASDARWNLPRAVADGVGGMIIATVELPAEPDRVFRALVTDEMERWWGAPEFYRQSGWSADLSPCGAWSVTTELKGGRFNRGWGEFVELDRPRKIVMTRNFEAHPLQGGRETTITYRLEPSAVGTRLTVREEGYAGRPAAAYGNAEHWERVLGWLKAYLAAGAA